MWKTILEYPNYEVSDKGEVRNKYTGCVLKQHIKNGYYFVVFRIKGHGYNQYVHRLVAKAFIPNFFNNEFINHKDENKLNNNVNNLEWCTPKYNRNYGSTTAKLRDKFSISIVGENDDCIFIYKSFTIAAKENNVTQGAISYIFRNKRKGLGVNWRYATPKEIELLGNKDSITLRKWHYKSK